MRRKIRAIVKKPGEPVGHKITLDNELGAFQRLVDGPIETVTFLRGVVAIVNEEGKIRGLKPNIRIMGEQITGTVVVVGVWGEDFDDCPLNLQTWRMFLEDWGNET